MRKLTAGGMTNKLKAKARVTLSALDMKKLILTNLPYLFIFLFADRASCLYRASPGADVGNKLLYAMEHADRILTGFLPSLYYMDVLVGAGIAAVVKILVWQKQADAKKLRKGVEYGSARWGTAEDIKPFMADDFWMNIPLTATESIMPLKISKRQMVSARIISKQMNWWEPLPQIPMVLHSLGISRLENTM